MSIYMVLSPENADFIQRQPMILREYFNPPGTYVPFHSDPDKALQLAMMSPGGIRDAQTRGGIIWHVLTLTFTFQQWVDFTFYKNIKCNYEGTIHVFNDVAFNGPYEFKMQRCFGPVFTIDYFEEILPLRYPCSPVSLCKTCQRTGSMVFGKDVNRCHCARCWRTWFRNIYKSFEDQAAARNLAIEEVD